MVDCLISGFKFLRGFRRLACNRSGNVIALIGAAVVPILAMVGGAVDISRSYLAESRLQQACDAGVLAARKKLANTLVLDGLVPTAVAAVGNQYFKQNFRDGAYGTTGRSFAMTLEPDSSISGLAAVNVPTTVMQMFGSANVAVKATCEARLNFNNTDVMMVLDTTGSMQDPTPAPDGRPRITVLKEVVKNFHQKMETSKGPGTLIRYGFVPYSANVNVGHLLKDEWVVSDWHYQSRENAPSTTQTTNQITYENVVETGTVLSSFVSSHSQTMTAGPRESGRGSYTCNATPPPNTYNQTVTTGTPVSTPYSGPPAGTKTVTHYKTVETGTSYYLISPTPTTCELWKSEFNNLTREGDVVSTPVTLTIPTYNYDRLPKNVANWRTETEGCMEERDTYLITDYNNIDFTKALDLNIDMIPNGSDDSKWRPMYPAVIYERSLNASGSFGAFTPAPVLGTTDSAFFQPSSDPALVACPAKAQLVEEMDAAQVSTFLDTLTPMGSTYHDIGMIWGGRLLSKFGLFATHNEKSGSSASRHLIFLTDGLTAPMDIVYGAYGVEPLDRRRWVPPTSPSDESLTQVVEKRFAAACDEVKKRGITVWVIGFGTSLNTIMTDCAGPGRYFEATNASQLDNAFTTIATSMAELRIAK